MAKMMNDHNRKNLESANTNKIIAKTRSYKKSISYLVGKKELVFLRSERKGTMKLPTLAVATLSLSCKVLAASSHRERTLFPWTKKKAFYPIIGRGGSTSAAATSSDNNVLLARDEEATKSLKVSVPLSQSDTLSQNDAPLTRDISMLTEILSDLVQHENPKLNELYEEFVGYGRQR